MGGFTPNPSMYAQAPGGYPPAAQPSGYGAPAPNQQSYGLYPQPGGGMQHPQSQGMGYPGQPGQPGQPMPGYPGAPQPNQPMPGYGGAPAPSPGYPKVPSPNPSMPAYGGGGGVMPIAPPINVRNTESKKVNIYFCIDLCNSMLCHNPFFLFVK